MELATLNHLNGQVEALLDSGAYHNYLSFEVVKGTALEDMMQPVHNQYVLLGGTDKKLPVLGKVTVSVQLGGTTAEIKCHVFETTRPLIIGLESLVMYFSELFIKRLEELRFHLQQLDLNGEKHSINMLSDLLYPREPYGHSIDSKVIRTTLKAGEEVQIGYGFDEVAEEEATAEAEYRDVFDIAPTTVQEYHETKIGAMFGDDCKTVTEMHSGNLFDAVATFTDTLRGSLGILCYTYTDWTGIIHDPFEIKLKPDAPHFHHAHVRHIAKGLYEPAKNSVNKFRTDGYRTV